MQNALRELEIIGQMIGESSEHTAAQVFRI